METKEPIPIRDICLTSPAVISKDQDVVVSWKTSNQEILGYEICVGTAAGQWDQLICQVGKDVRAIKLPGLSPDITQLFVEFSYTINSEIPSEAMHHHESSESVVLHEAWEISRV
ncbi:MAG: hypothetical protein LV473_18065 [Nitrospira sp.]|nr:hypothetical protein [Nitrospira sp.]